MSRRADLLEFAVLGLLHEVPMHGYELRKRLNAALGPFRALSYGTLYPCLKTLLDRGLIEPDPTATEPVPPARRSTSRSAESPRYRNVYRLTEAGRDRFAEQVNRIDATAYEDDAFDVRLAFFSRTEAEVRMRILEGRRSFLEVQLANLRTASTRNRARLDAYTAALASHGEEQAEREVRWVTSLINAERTEPAVRRGPLTDPSHPAFNPPPVGGTPHTSTSYQTR